MSCMIMNPESLAAIANATKMLLNCGYKYFGFEAPSSMHDAFQDCRKGYSYDAACIYKKLYAVNLAAYNGRYKENETNSDDEATNIDVSLYKIHKWPEYDDNHHAVRQWHYHLAKLVDFWLYQTCEEATWNDKTRAAMVDFQRVLFEFIVQRSIEYENAPAWGLL